MCCFLLNEFPYSNNLQSILHATHSIVRERKLKWNSIHQQLLAGFFQLLILPFGIRNCNKSGNKQARRQRRQKIEMNWNWNEVIYAWPIEWLAGETLQHKFNCVLAYDIKEAHLTLHRVCIDLKWVGENL